MDPLCMFVVEEIGGQLHNHLVYPNLQVNNLPLRRYVPFLSGPNHLNFLNGNLLAIWKIEITESTSILTFDNIQGKTND